MRIHREGYPHIPLSFLIITGLVAGGWYLHPWLGYLLLAAGFVLFFFNRLLFPKPRQKNRIRPKKYCFSLRW